MFNSNIMMGNRIIETIPQNGEWSGSTASFTFTSGRALRTAIDKAVYYSTLIKGDFDVVATLTEQGGRGHFGVFDKDEIATFNQNQPTGGLHSMTASYWASLQASGAGDTEGTMLGGASQNAFTWANGEVCKISRRGNTITIYQDATLKTTINSVSTDDMYVVVGGGGSSSPALDLTSLQWTEL